MTRWVHRWPLLARPEPALAVTLLALNDHVLKQTVGGWWSGKLSDIAGVVVLAWALTVISGYAGASALVTAAGFVVLKTVPGGSELCAPLLGGTTRRDPIDLIAVLVLVPLVVRLRGLLARDVRRPVWSALRRCTRATVAGAVACGAALAVSATSPGPHNDLDLLRTDDAGTVWVRATTQEWSTSGDGSSVTHVVGWARSVDGGHRWTEASPRPTTAPGARTATPSACSREAGCFRLAGNPGSMARVEHRASGQTWVTEVDCTPPGQTGVCASGQGLLAAPRSLLIAHRPDGDHVVVAAGSAVLHRDASGRWEHLSVLGSDPDDGSVSPGSVVSGALKVLIVVLAVAAALVVGVRALTRAYARRRPER